MKAKRKSQQPGRTVLKRLRKHFPGVKKVVDATESVSVSVTKADSDTGRKKDPNNCALAKACVRQGADGAVINIGFSYIIKGDTATRYKTSATVGREITSFDRHQDFAEGKDHLLSKVAPTERLGKRKASGDRTNPQRWHKAQVHHHSKTARIRVAKA